MRADDPVGTPDGQLQRIVQLEDAAAPETAEDEADGRCVEVLDPPARESQAFPHVRMGAALEGDHGEDRFEQGVRYGLDGLFDDEAHLVIAVHVGDGVVAIGALPGRGGLGVHDPVVPPVLREEFFDDPIEPRLDVVDLVNFMIQQDEGIVRDVAGLVADPPIEPPVHAGMVRAIRIDELLMTLIELDLHGLAHS